MELTEREQDGNSSTCTRLIRAPGCRTMAGNECMELFPANGHACPLSRGLVAPRRPAVNRDVTLCRFLGTGLVGNVQGGREVGCTYRHLVTYVYIAASSVVSSLTL